MRSRRSILRRPKIIVDTSFLLPALGIEVEEEVLEVIPLFRRVEVYYLEIGLIEALWKVLRIVPLEKVHRVKMGVEAIKRTYHLLEPPANAYTEAINIYHRGHRDYIDALYYATAKATGLPWLTIDYPFIEFLEKHGYPVQGIVLTPKEFRRLVSQLAL